MIGDLGEAADLFLDTERVSESLVAGEQAARCVVIRLAFSEWRLER